MSHHDCQFFHRYRFQDRDYPVTLGLFVPPTFSCPVIYLARKDASDPPMWISSEPLPISVCKLDLKADLDSDPIAFDIDDEDEMTRSIASLVSLASLDLEDGEPYLSNVGTRQSLRRFFCTHSDCPKSFLTEDDMALHLQGHGPITFPCAMCGLIYPGQTELVQHQKVCLG
ncbi:hypothetical protein BKA57DRAFT_460253 [Linnemannia elongata]|nr:hypothetical protein BKA57DRAFT_460253 [Linnemannia elongata]